MIISTLEELRLFSPSNAVDNIESLAGFLSSSESDFLKEKLGDPLYRSLSDYYFSNILNCTDTYISQLRGGMGIPCYARLLYLAQRAVVFDALARYVSIQAVSVNGMGVNVVSAEDYKTADSQTIGDFKKACVKESHTAVNELLQQLESWAEEIAVNPDEDAEKTEIAVLWEKSRYFYIVTELIIPNAQVLQHYYNFYENRERFIQMLPDLRYIQEDILAPIFGEDLVEYLASYPWTKGSANVDKHTTRIHATMCKIMARYLECRMLKATDPRHAEARNEALKLTERLSAYMQSNQGQFDADLSEAFRTSPLWKDESAKPVERKFENNAPGSAMFVTPGLI